MGPSCSKLKRNPKSKSKTIKPTKPTKISNTTSPANYEDILPSGFEEIDLEPGPDELSDDEWVEVEDREWTDEQLMDNARPGRRKACNKRNRDTAIECAIRETELERLEREEMERERPGQLINTEGGKETKNEDEDQKPHGREGKMDGADKGVSNSRTDSV